MDVLGIHLNDYSAEALVALFVILIFLGVWVPRREVTKWQRAAERSADQVDKLIASVDPMVKFIGKLKEQHEEGLASGDPARETDGKPEQEGRT